LGFGIVQVAVRHATEDFSGWLIEDRDLVGPLVEEGLSSLSWLVLTGIVKYINLLQQGSVYARK
jgi:hypothetical protein